MKNKNIIEELICHELSRLDGLLEVLKELNIAKIPPKGYLSKAMHGVGMKIIPQKRRKNGC